MNAIEASFALIVSLAVLERRLAASFEIADVIALIALIEAERDKTFKAAHLDLRHHASELLREARLVAGELLILMQRLQTAAADDELAIEFDIELLLLAFPGR